MAHGLEAERRPKLHQALHGYADGHRQLALSMTLRPRDQRTLLALSDISGPGARLEEGGYLTGYPLSESRLYALARTWPAPEMPRPGCVWTHTLFIDFTDLGALESLTGLLKLFRRPGSVSAAHEYAKPTLLAIGAQSTVATIGESWGRQIIGALYEKPQSRIVVTRSQGEIDGTVLALWSQQWPRLRRSFRFCTFAISDRSADGSSFDLQVLPSMDRSVRARFSDVIDADAVAPSANGWLDDAVQDLLYPDHQGLRTFFRRIGGDLATGREAFRPLCRLHRAIAALQKQPKSIHDAIVILHDEFGAKEASMARVLVAEAALQQVENLDEESFRFLWKNLDALDPDMIADSAVRIGHTAWRRDPRMLVPLLKDESRLRVVIERTLADLNLVELIQGLAHAPNLRSLALSCRPELVAEPAFWVELDAIEDAFQAAKSRGVEAAALAAMLKAGRSDLAPRGVREFGSRIALQVLSAAPDDANLSLRAWVQSAARDTGAVAEFLATQSGIPRSFLYALTRVLSPDAVPNDYGVDPWLIACQKASGSISETDSVYIAAYLLSRALGARSRSQAELAQLGFEITHAAAAGSYLPEDAWQLLEPRLPWSGFWFDWDRCQRLRAGVTSLFLERDLSPLLFATLVKETTLFLLLAREVAQTWRGRNFLKRVRKAIRGRIDLVERLNVLEELLG